MYARTPYSGHNFIAALSSVTGSCHNCYFWVGFFFIFFIFYKAEGMQNRYRSTEWNGASRTVHVCSYDQRKLNTVLRI